MKQGQIKQIERILEDKKIKMMGVEIELTKEQVKEFEKMIKPKNPYERVGVNEEYYSLELRRGESYIVNHTYYNDVCSKEYYANCNHISNKNFAEQVAMDLNLQQMLRKFTYENGWNDEFWEDENVSKVTIFFDTRNKSWGYLGDRTGKQGLFGVYFKDFEVAKRAMEEIVEPFCKENPNYRFQEE